MNYLSDREKQELLRLSRSASVREDFRKLREYRRERNRSRKEYTLDQYLDFINMMNSLANHARKPFREIKGDKFIL
ncbi:MAG: hypothetical protein ACE14V_08205 [bacterium]